MNGINIRFIGVDSLNNRNDIFFTYAAWRKLLNEPCNVKIWRKQYFSKHNFFDLGHLLGKKFGNKAVDLGIDFRGTLLPKITYHLGGDDKRVESVSLDADQIEAFDRGFRLGIKEAFSLVCPECFKEAREKRLADPY